MRDFKFLSNNDDYPFSLPIIRRMAGRTINQDLYRTTTLNELSTLQQIERYGSFYDSVVINRVRTSMRQRINWRGYECWLAETDGYTKLKIVSGINIGGMLHIVYLTTINDNTEHHRVSVPLSDLQRG